MSGRRSRHSASCLGEFCSLFPSDYGGGTLGLYPQRGVVSRMFPARNSAPHYTAEAASSDQKQDAVSPALRGFLCGCPLSESADPGSTSGRCPSRERTGKTVP